MKFMPRILAAAVSLAAVCSSQGADALYKKFEPADPTPRPQENIDWNEFVSFNARDEKSPRVLLVGDSIVNGFKEAAAARLGASGVNVSAWSSSMCASDPDYIFALNLAIEQGRWDAVGFHNGGHLHMPDWRARKAHIENALDFISAKLPRAKLFLISRTPLKDGRKIADEALFEISRERGIPIVDFISLMEGMDPGENWAGDGVHFREPGKRFQGDAVAKAALEALEMPGGRKAPAGFPPDAAGWGGAGYILFRGFNTKSAEGERIVFLGGETRHAAEAVRERLASVANISYCDTSTPVCDPDYARISGYALSLLPPSAVVFAPPPPRPGGESEWRAAYREAVGRISASAARPKLILCRPHGGSENAFIGALAREKGLGVADLPAGLGAPASADALAEAVCRAFGWPADARGNVVQKGTKAGPDGEIK